MGSSYLRWAVKVTVDALTEPEPSQTSQATGSVPVPVGITLSGVTVSPGRDISIDVTLNGTTEGVHVNGRIQAHWQGPCARCMTPLDGQTDITVRELFSTAPVEGEHYPLESEHVDLTQMVREAILLELPIHAVPCPNPAPCPNLPAEQDGQYEFDKSNTKSKQAERDPRWAALDVLRTDIAPKPDLTDP